MDTVLAVSLVLAQNSLTVMLKCDEILTRLLVLNE